MEHGHRVSYAVAFSHLSECYLDFLQECYDFLNFILMYYFYVHDRRKDRLAVSQQATFTH